MTINGWRTLILEKGSFVGIADGCLTIECDGTFSVPLQQLKCVIITSQTVTITASALNALIQNNINLVVCDEKKSPVGEIIGYRNHNESAGRLKKQIAWTGEYRRKMWQVICRAKISSQRKLLEMIDSQTAEQLLVLEKEVLPDDASYCESRASALYFPALFGTQFNRRSPTPENSALNYGYAILLSSVNRLVVLHGYSTLLGIKHCNDENPFNLSCDIMEPFRPFVDRYVLCNIGRELDFEYKKELVAMWNGPVMYKGCRYELQTALETFVEDFFRSMQTGDFSVGELDFV